MTCPCEYEFALTDIGRGGPSDCSRLRACSGRGAEFRNGLAQADTDSRPPPRWPHPATLATERYNAEYWNLQQAAAWVDYRLQGLVELCADTTTDHLRLVAIHPMMPLRVILFHSILKLLVIHGTDGNWEIVTDVRPRHGASGSTAGVGAGASPGSSQERRRLVYDPPERVDAGIEPVTYIMLDQPVVADMLDLD